MRSKSFPVRSSLHRASRKSLDPNPSPASLPGEANERFVSGVSTTHCYSDDADDVDIVPDSFDDIDVPHKKRHCIGTSETNGGGRSNLDACIVCDISDERVSRCSGTDCFISFHGECLNPDLSSSEDLAKAYCPYCWFKVVLMRHKSVSEKAVGAKSRDEEEENVPMGQEDTTLYGDEIRNKVGRTDVVKDQELRGEKDVCSSEKEQLQVEKASHQSREEDMPLTEEDTEKFEDAEEDKDEETTKDQTEDNTGAVGGKGDVSQFSGQEQEQIQQNETPRRRRRQLILKDIDSEISSEESANERNGEDVTEQITSRALVVTSLSRTIKNQQRKHSTITEVAKSKTERDISSFKRDQRRRLFWTPEEEEMLRVGVEKFSAEAKKNMPWRKILEMGEEVFHETRTPADLKDKWRNMMFGGRGKKAN